MASLCLLGVRLLLFIGVVSAHGIFFLYLSRKFKAAPIRVASVRQYPPITTLSTGEKQQFQSKRYDQVGSTLFRGTPVINPTIHLAGRLLVQQDSKVHSNIKIPRFNLSSKSNKFQEEPAHSPSRSLLRDYNVNTPSHSHSRPQHSSQSGVAGSVSLRPNTSVTLPTATQKQENFVSSESFLSPKQQPKLNNIPAAGAERSSKGMKRKHEDVSMEYEK